MSRMSHRPRVIMLAKPPRAGRVKTRLTNGSGLTPADAAAFYAACVADLTARLADQPGYELLVCAPPGQSDADLALLAGLLPAGVKLVVEPVAERTRDFGQVMEDVAFAWLRHDEDAVALLSSDCALLTAEQLSAAVAQFATAELVLGPDDGGGCYLIGLRRKLPLLTGPAEFGPVAWSQGTDFAELRRRADALGIRVALAERERDVDSYADLVWLAERLSTDPAAAETAPRLAAWCAACELEGRR